MSVVALSSCHNRHTKDANTGMKWDSTSIYTLFLKISLKKFGDVEKKLLFCIVFQIHKTRDGKCKETITIKPIQLLKTTNKPNRYALMNTE